MYVYMHDTHYVFWAAKRQDGVCRFSTLGIVIMVFGRYLRVLSAALNSKALPSAISISGFGHWRVAGHRGVRHWRAPRNFRREGSRQLPYYWVSVNAIR